MHHHPLPIKAPGRRSRLIWIGTAALLVLGVATMALVQGWWRQAEPVRLEGRTMGTTWHVIAHGGRGVAADVLRERVQARLDAIDGSMSTWQPDSELSRLNAAPPGEPVAVSEDLAKVLSRALALGKATDGALDITVGPVVNLWGFGPEEHFEPPTDTEIAAALARTGLGKLELRDGRVIKHAPDMYVDLSAIAKGYGVDEAARVVLDAGFTNALVEIGGEVVARGTRADGTPWQIGLEAPRADEAPGEAVYAVLPLADGAVATSGSYRRFKRYKDARSHHIIDPHTGRPTSLSLVSVSVLAPDCMTADGVATALMVMGVEEGLRWLEPRSELEALFTTANGDGGFTRHASEGFPAVERLP